MRTCARPRRLLSLSLLVLAACGGEDEQEAASVPTASAPVAPPSLPVTQASWAPTALEELLAPIALYPDQLLTQILAASVNSQEVLDGGNWLLDHQDLKGDALDAAARQAGFGAAMRALLQFPTVVDMLCQQIDWTRQVGSAFSSDQKSVLDAVQRLRLQASQVGNLHSTPQQTVETKTENNQTIVEVKPADPQVVYVPQYNPQVVYTTPPPAPAPAPASSDDTVSTETAVAAGLIGFGLGALVGGAFDDDDDYCCYPNWGHSTVVVGARPFYPPAYTYRPAYGSGFRPAYHYNNDYQRGRQGNVTNINVDNSEYFNRFSNNQNLRAGTSDSPLSSRGQSTYRGARDDATTQRLNQAAGARSSSPQARSANTDRGYGMDSSLGSRQANEYRGDPASRERTASTGNTASPGSSEYRGNTQRSGSDMQRSASNAQRSGSDLQRSASDVQRSSADTQRSGSDMQRSSADTQRSSSDMQRSVSDVQRGGAELERPASDIQRSDAASAGAAGRAREGAFSGARDSGSFERSASARGRASAGGRGGGGRRR